MFPSWVTTFLWFSEKKRMIVSREECVGRLNQQSRQKFSFWEYYISYEHLFTQPIRLRTGYDTISVWERITAVFFFFSENGCLTKDKEPSLSYYSTIAGSYEIDSRLSQRQTFGIWTRITDCISVGLLKTSSKEIRGFVPSFKIVLRLYFKIYFR